MTDDGSRGERALMCAVLADALDCLFGRTAARHPELAAEAGEWIESRDEEWPYSFENICATLSIDPDRVRARLRDYVLQAPPARVHVAPVGGRRPGRVGSVDPEAVSRMILSGQRLRSVADAFGISVARASTLSQGLSTRIRAARDADIRRLHAEGASYRELARRFGLSRVRVIRICTRARRMLEAASVEQAVASS